MRAIISFTSLLFAFFSRDAAAQDYVLPIDCRVGDICVVQNYVDLDPGDGARDANCGPLTYDGHDGLDFRAPAALARAGLSVLAPAAGIVRGVRDGEADEAFLRGGPKAIDGRECGNGVSIEHGDGRTSQLCHLRKGSVRVRVGERVASGQPIGLVGMSGRTQFPHVHLSIRRNGETLDPLTGAPLGSQSCGEAAATPGAHWSQAAQSALAYRGARFFAAGFTGAAPAEGVRAEDLPANAAPNAPALVFWALASGPMKGDILRVRLYGPDAVLISKAVRTQPRDQAEAWVFAGKRTPPQGWPSGQYRGEVRFERSGHVIETHTELLTLTP